MDNPFAAVPSDAESIVAWLKRAALEECAAGACLVHPVLDRCARDAVFELWDSPVKTFVPLLALRRVRCCVRAGSCDTIEW